MRVSRRAVQLLPGDVEGDRRVRAGGPRGAGCLSDAWGWRRADAFVAPPSGADPLVRGRPPGRPAGARPTILTCLFDQPRSHGTLLDIVLDLAEFLLIAHQVVVAFFLPERLAGAG